MGHTLVTIVPEEPAYSENPFYVDLMKPTYSYDLGDSIERPNYYQEGMSHFKDEKFIVFSDEIGWCKNQTIFHDCEFSEGRSAIEDMNLMASCKGHIIANSSFSWWAAWLSENKTVAPKRWFTNPDSARISYPDSWILI